MELNTYKKYMNNSIIILNISKYLCIDLHYFSRYLGTAKKQLLIEMWCDIKEYTSNKRMKCSKIVAKTNLFAVKNGYTFSHSLASCRHKIDRMNFLENILDLRYYVENKYPIKLHNLPAYVD
jgi:hypothetical protein